MEVAVDRLRRMHEAAGGSTPVGFENLALAMVPFSLCSSPLLCECNSSRRQGMEDVVNQGAFIEAMLRPFGSQGVMLLDLHNLYCQIVNFSLDPEEAMKRYL